VSESPRAIDQLVIDSLAAGGDGVGRDETGRVTFVPRTAPGDRVRCELIDERRAWARGRLLEVIEAGPGRADPRCPLFVAETCGGCQWQHLAATVQAAAKREIVATALRGVAAGALIEAMVTPVDAYAWRRRARLHWFRPRGREAAVIGLFAPRSQRVTPVVACPQMVVELQPVLVELAATLAPGLHKRGEIELVVGHQGRVHVTIRGPVTTRAARALVGRAGIVGVRAGPRKFGERSVELEPGLDTTGGEFHQASEAGNRALIEAVLELGDPAPHERVLELYAGSGNFTRALSERAAQVVAVDARARARLAGVNWRREPADRALRALADAGRTFELVVLDPPRTGAREAMEPLVALAPARVIYVSCDPATLGRDLAVLSDGGYRVVRVRPMDLMPQTAHVEVLVRAERV
jgi:23S rRNA (uracil1939-C5)-methyltransferase